MFPKLHLELLFQNKKKNIICIDGDGSLLMHLGSILMNSNLKNFTHILINNGVHDSVGGQAINSKNIEYSKIAKIFKYKNSIKIFQKKKIKKNIKNLLKKKGSSFIEILSKPDMIKVLADQKNNLNIEKKFY